MKFQWDKYDNTYEKLVDSWLDDTAVRLTGLNDGWNDFYAYWRQESEHEDTCEDFCFIVSEYGEPFAVIYISTQSNELTVSEYIVAPRKRGKGLGSAAMKEFLDHCDVMVGKNIVMAKAVIYPNNIASQRALEKAGFTFVSAHPDGDAWYYEYTIKKMQNPQI